MKATVGVLALLLIWNQDGTSQPPSPASTKVSATSLNDRGSPGTPPAPNTLLDGTPVKLRLGETISSANASTGQEIPFEVTEDVLVQGVTVIAKGATAVASVTAAESKKSMGRGGKLNVNIDYVRLIDNEKAQLRATQENKGGGHVGAMTGAIVATAVVFFPAAPLFMFIKGKDITIPKGTEITAFIEGDMRLDAATFGLPPIPAPAPATVAPAPATPGVALVPAVARSVPAAGSPAPSAPVLASVAIDSSVKGADIEVDGQFAGNTPSTITVIPGRHTVVVKKNGYAVWSRSLTVAGSGVHLSADLGAQTATTRTSRARTAPVRCFPASACGTGDADTAAK